MLAWATGPSLWFAIACLAGAVACGILASRFR